MSRRQDSILAPAALVVLLGLTLVYGCRAFDPEPVIVNRVPQTWIVGAPAETTGGSFQRHLYWFGSDEDGEVVQFIYAITDSSVQKPNDPDGLDEEDDRFNPFENITTVTEPEGIVGWTTKTDSVFTFLVDRGPTTSKDITFHIVAVDDRGAIDRTPARLHFIDNSLGNPSFRFEVYIDEGPGGGSPPQWNLHWVGDPSGVDAGASPEASSRPFIGFERRFRVAWEASSPNGPIVGYRFKADQGEGEFTPATVAGKKQWDSALTEFVYSNDQPPASLPAPCDPTTASGCPPESVRFASGNYSLLVEALDVALVESAPGAGELRFEINYPPETDVYRGDDGSGVVWPRYELHDENWNLLSEQSFAEGDTVPTGAYVKFRASAHDRVPSWAGAEFDSFCCDQVFDPSVPSVRFQTRLQFSGYDGARNLLFSNTFSSPEPADSIGFITGAFNYDVVLRSVDEHRRPDETPETVRFVSGLPPRVTSVAPSVGDTLMLRDPTAQQNWPENEYPYTVSGTVKLWWDGLQYLTTDCGERCVPVSGNYYTFRPRFEAATDAREARSSVGAWTYSVHSVNDPPNVITDGISESPDLSSYRSVSTDGFWELSEEEGFKIFLPLGIWFAPQFYDPGSLSTKEAQQGAYLRRRLGEIVLQVRARNSRLGDEYDLFQDTRPGDGQEIQQTIDMERLGRRSAVYEVRYHILLGTAPAGTDSIVRRWPDY